MMRLTILATLLATPAFAQDVPQEFTADQFWQQIKRSCLHENPMMFERNADSLATTHGWTQADDPGSAKAIYVSPGGNVEVRVERFAASGRCKITAMPGAIDPDFDAVPLLQERVDKYADTAVEPRQEDGDTVWRWEGEDAYQMQTYEVRTKQGNGLEIDWITE